MNLNNKIDTILMKTEEKHLEYLLNDIIDMNYLSGQVDKCFCRQL